MVSDKDIRVGLYNRLNQQPLVGLLGDGSASIVHEEAHPTISFPLCIFSKQAGTHRHVFGGTTSTRPQSGTMPAQAARDAGYRDSLWIVKGVAKDPQKPGRAEDVDEAVHDLLNFGDGVLTITGADVMGLHRVSDIRYTEAEDDNLYWHVGGMYRLVVQESQ